MKMEYYILFIWFVLWLYSSICFFLMGIGNSFYIQNMPMMDELGTYQSYHFIPLCLFTTYYDKKVYIDIEN